MSWDVFKWWELVVWLWWSPEGDVRLFEKQESTAHELDTILKTDHLYDHLFWDYKKYTKSFILEALGLWGPHLLSAFNQYRKQEKKVHIGTLLYCLKNVFDTSLFLNANQYVSLLHFVWRENILTQTKCFLTWELIRKAFSEWHTLQSYLLKVIPQHIGSHTQDFGEWTQPAVEKRYWKETLSDVDFEELFLTSDGSFSELTQWWIKNCKLIWLLDCFRCHSSFSYLLKTHVKRIPWWFSVKLPFGDPKWDWIDVQKEELFDTGFDGSSSKYWCNTSPNLRETMKIDELWFEDTYKKWFTYIEIAFATYVAQKKSNQHYTHVVDYIDWNQRYSEYDLFKKDFFDWTTIRFWSLFENKDFVSFFDRLQDFQDGKCILRPNVWLHWLHNVSLSLEKETYTLPPNHDYSLQTFFVSEEGNVVLFVWNPFDTSSGMKFTLPEFFLYFSSLRVENIIS